jgi:hypothetical protein
MENRSFDAIIGSANAPYINSLAAMGAVFSDSHGVTHPSQPNYLWLFSGSDQGVTDNSCPHVFSTANLAQGLIDNAWSFAGFSEGLPAEGSLACNSGKYARKHNPVPSFSNVPSSANKPYSAFPSDYSTLPTVSFVVPNLDNDMHDGTVAEGDAWLQQNLGGYVNWAPSNDSLLILTWDEDDGGSGNHIATVFVGSMVAPGSYAETIDHVDILRTIEDMYGVPYAGASNVATPITDAWNTCGDGVADAGEECGEPSLSCGTAQVCRACACVGTPVCASGIPFTKPSLSMRATPFAMSLKASAVIPKPWVGVDPAANGIRVVVDEPVGTGGVDVTLPGGANWKLNGSGTRWTYTDKSGAISDITKASVTDQSSKQDGLLNIRVKGKGGTATLPGASQARMAVVFGTADECAAVSFTGSSLSCSGAASKIKCK